MASETLASGPSSQSWQSWTLFFPVRLHCSTSFKCNHNNLYLVWLNHTLVVCTSKGCPASCCFYFYTFLMAKPKINYQTKLSIYLYLSSSSSSWILCTVLCYFFLKEQKRFGTPEYNQLLTGGLLNWCLS